MIAVVEKYSPDGTLVIRYEGELVAQDAEKTVFGGYFQIDVPKPYVHFRHGDRTVETFYPGRWYNIVELRDRDDDHLKGWYCNISYPPTITRQSFGTLIVYIDLALDVFVYPNGELLVLDQDELEAVNLDDDTLAQVWSAVELLQEMTARREEPFNQIKA